jgi:hypothetical protein
VHYQGAIINSLRRGQADTAVQPGHMVDNDKKCCHIHTYNEAHHVGRQVEGPKQVAILPWIHLVSLARVCPLIAQSKVAFCSSPETEIETAVVEVPMSN